MLIRINRKTGETTSAYIYRHNDTKSPGFYRQAKIDHNHPEIIALIDQKLGRQAKTEAAA